jgi:hypothetical protein
VAIPVALVCILIRIIHATDTRQKESLRLLQETVDLLQENNRLPAQLNAGKTVGASD